MSYVVEAAIAVEAKGAAATRGWFRIDPGACRTVIQGTPPGETLYIHARALPVYGGSPLPQAGHADFCVGADTFAMPATQSCNRTGQHLARFTAIKPSETDKGLVAYLAEDAEYDDTQARDAGIQRLLTIAGYDAGPIDGVRGEKTDQALAQFITDNKLENTAAGRADFFDLLMAAAQRPNGAGFAWCNETRNVVMAALGFEDSGTVVTRGWYRVAPGKCLRPDLTGKPQRLYSFGEAVGADGQPLGSARRSRRPGDLLGRLDHPVHPQRQVRAQRPQGLRQQRPDRDGLRHRGAGRRQHHGAVQVGRHGDDRSFARIAARPGRCMSSAA